MPINQIQQPNDPDNVYALLEVYPIDYENIHDQITAASVLEDLLIYCGNESAEVIEYKKSEYGLVSFTGIISNIYYKLKSKTGTHNKTIHSPLDKNNNKDASPVIGTSLVFVLPYYDNLPNIPENELKIETRENERLHTIIDVKLTHIPTGLVVRSTQKESVSENKDIAMKVLKNKILHILY